MNIAALHAAYAAGSTTPEETVTAVFERIDATGLAPVWISLAPRAQAIARCRDLAQRDRSQLPLYGVPFAVKDNIDVAGLPTTAGCPAYSYQPEQSATVVTRLEAAGAILIGKTNMDQFATGLVGTRTPYSICSSVFSARHISGGSSSGSAVATASGLVSFALGTDTAGSGRVPAAFNNLVGLKPTRGLVSTHGVVPACRTLDCVSIFAETIADAAAILRVAQGEDAADPYSRSAPLGDGAAPWATAATFRFGVPRPEQREFFGDRENAALYEASITAMEQVGGTAVAFDLAPFRRAGALLYGGPWVAERYAAMGAFLETHADAIDPTVRSIIAGAKQYTAADLFRGMYELEALQKQTRAVWRELDLLLLPTVPRAFTIEEVRAAPMERNSELGTYTNFVNLLDLAAVAVPAGMRRDGLPFSVTLMAPAFSDLGLLPLADRLHRRLATHLGGSTRLLPETPAFAPPMTPPGCLLMAVVGAHLTGQPLNWQLTTRRGRLVRTCRTHPDYRLYALKATAPAKPGLLWDPTFSGPGIEVEVWGLPEDTVGGFVDGVPPPLAIGNLRLEDGSYVKGFLAEPAALAEATEITRFGSWRRYLEDQRAGGGL